MTVAFGVPGGRAAHRKAALAPAAPGRRRRAAASVAAQLRVPFPSAGTQRKIQYCYF